MSFCTFKQLIAHRCLIRRSSYGVIKINPCSRKKKIRRMNLHNNNNVFYFNPHDYSGIDPSVRFICYITILSEFMTY